jgi:hypothetical protein
VVQNIAKIVLLEKKFTRAHVKIVQLENLAQQLQTIHVEIVKQENTTTRRDCSIACRAIRECTQIKLVQWVAKHVEQDSIKICLAIHHVCDVTLANIWMKLVLSTVWIVIQALSLTE